ncbi:hypothetical protein D3C85_1122400 [compost metagenome]
MTAGIVQFGWVVCLDLVAVGNKPAGVFMDLEQGLLHGQQLASPGSAFGYKTGDVFTAKYFKVQQRPRRAVMVLIHAQMAYQFTGFDGDGSLQHHHRVFGLGLALCFEQLDGNKAG